MASLLDEVLHGKERGGLAEQVARQMLTERMKTFEAMVETEVRRRLAEDRGAEAVAKTAVKPLVEQVEFLRASRGRPRRAAPGGLPDRPPARDPADRPAPARPERPARRPPYRPGLAVDRRRADHDDLPAAQAAQARARRALRRQRVGRGVRPLHGAAGVRAARAVREGAGVRVRRHHRRGDAVLRPGRRRRRRAGADVVRRPTSCGSTGTATTGTRSRSSPRTGRTPSTPKTSLLVLGDARTNYRAPALPALRSVARQARHAFWLNPEPRQYWASGDSAASTLRRRDADGRVPQRRPAAGVRRRHPSGLTGAAAGEIASAGDARPRRRGDVGGRAGGAADHPAARTGRPAARARRRPGPPAAGAGRRARRAESPSATCRRLPTTAKTDLWDSYPFGMLAVPREEVAAVHGSSGTARAAHAGRLHPCRPRSVGVARAHGRWPAPAPARRRRFTTRTATACSPAASASTSGLSRSVPPWSRSPAA